MRPAPPSRSFLRRWFPERRHRARPLDPADLGTSYGLELSLEPNSLRRDGHLGDRVPSFIPRATARSARRGWWAMWRRG